MIICCIKVKHDILNRYVPGFDFCLHDWRLKTLDQTLSLSTKNVMEVLKLFWTLRQYVQSLRLLITDQQGVI